MFSFQIAMTFNRRRKELEIATALHFPLETLPSLRTQSCIFAFNCSCLVCWCAGNQILSLSTCFFCVPCPDSPEHSCIYGGLKALDLLLDPEMQLDLLRNLLLACIYVELSCFVFSLMCFTSGFEFSVIESTWISMDLLLAFDFLIDTKDLTGLVEQTNLCVLFF